MKIDFAIEILADSNALLTEQIKLLKKNKSMLAEPSEKKLYNSTEYCSLEFEAVEMAIIALREQQAREKGCDYCGLIYKLDGASYDTDSVMIENRFCPMCGKAVGNEDIR